MASGGTPEDGILPGPWLPSPGEESPLWGWTGDDETLPLLASEGEDNESLVSEKVIDELNRFGNSLWTPLRALFPPQEQLMTQLTFMFLLILQ